MSLVRVNLFFMSIHGGVLILVALLLRRLFRGKLPGRTFPVLWCIVLFRLLAPFSVSSPLSVYSLLGQQAGMLLDKMADEENSGSPYWEQSAGLDEMTGGDFAGDSLPEDNNYGDAIRPGENAGRTDGATASPTIGNKGMMNKSADFLNRRFHDMRRAAGLLRLICTGGTLICGAVFLVMYLSCMRLFGTAVPAEDPFVEQWMHRHRLKRKIAVRQSDRIASPLTYGMFRPVILLPKNLEKGQDERALVYILQHEMVHIRRFDGTLKLVMTAALCLHWFNPLVWIMYVLLNRDVELACDEEVLKTFGMGARKGYALTLIGMEERKFAPVSLYSGFGKNAVEERVGAIMKYKRKKKRMAGFAAALILAVVFLFATSVEAGGGNIDPGQETTLPAADRNAAEPQETENMLMDPPKGHYLIGNSQNPGADSNAADTMPMISESGSGESHTEGPVLFPGMSYASGEDDNFSLTYMVEGMEESEPAWLVYGQGYCVLMPKEGWKMSAPEEWASEWNEDVVFRVVHFSGEDSEYKGQSRNQIAESFESQGYQTQYQSYQLYKEEGDITSVVEIRSNGADIWGLVYTYPSEAEEGFGVTLRAMARHFGIIPVEKEANSEDSIEKLAVSRMVLKFVMACQEKDDRDIASCLSETFLRDDLDILEIVTEQRTGELSVTLHPEGDRAAASIPVRTTESDDSVDYLTIGLVKEGKEWKISSIGLEK